MGRPQDSQQGGYDIPQKELESSPDVFADILNALVYEGEQVVDFQRLSQAETETRYRDQKRRLRNQYEDLGRYETGREGNVKILYLVSNQSQTDSRMLLRKCGYVGGYYRGQYEQQMRESCPVMELVLYWGRKRWRTSRSMRELFKRKDLHPKAWKYIDDERIHVFEMRHLPRKVIERFRSDMRIILEYLADEEGADRLEQKVSHPAALMELMWALSGDDRYGTVMESLMSGEGTEEGGKWTVCKLMDKYWGGGKQEGLQQGRQEGIRVLISTCHELGATFETTASKVKEKYALDDARVKESMALYWQ
ncbi:MAG: Rpn family recombination-promoting nuclease/putative transposase [Lachnospiraceae bacterium]|nr:Rpn family recombination-promoting nuclease/putative transposase [Lachnospiraceae bacterium]MCM1238790.1 Rpn family recombination-promoting nuclease/putative transposase [Lachnospiraceae bacterium]